MNLVQFLKLLQLLSFENNLVDTKTIIKNIPRKIKCSIHEISDMKEHPKIYLLKIF
jgi:hypothetical protein